MYILQVLSKLKGEQKYFGTFEYILDSDKALCRKMIKSIPRRLAAGEEVYGEKEEDYQNKV